MVGGNCYDDVKSSIKIWSPFYQEKVTKDLKTTKRKKAELLP